MKVGTKFQVTDKSHPRYLEVYVIMFKIHDTAYGYGNNVNDEKSLGKINPKQIKVIEL
jgi:hypothetical protein